MLIIYRTNQRHSHPSKYLSTIWSTRVTLINIVISTAFRYKLLFSNIHSQQIPAAQWVCYKYFWLASFTTAVFLFWCVDCNTCFFLSLLLFKCINRVNLCTLHITIIFNNNKLPPIEDNSTRQVSFLHTKVKFVSISCWWHTAQFENLPSNAKECWKDNKEKYYCIINGRAVQWVVEKEEWPRV